MTQYRSEVQQLMKDQVQKCGAIARTNCYKAMHLKLAKQFPGHEGLYRVCFDKKTKNFVVEYVYDTVDPRKIPTAIGRYSIKRKGFTLGDFE